jgi:hypothetical protein
MSKYIRGSRMGVNMTFYEVPIDTEFEDMETGQYYDKVTENQGVLIGEDGRTGILCRFWSYETVFVV